MSSYKSRIATGGYVFVRNGESIVTQGKKGFRNNRELEIIAARYEQRRRERRPNIRPLSGKWHWCENPECPNVVYGVNSCSLSCHGKAFGFKRQLQPPKNRSQVLKWFLGLTDFETARWITDSALKKDGRFVDCLVGLLNSKAGSKLEWVFKLIFRAGAARRIVMGFLKTQEGEIVKNLIQSKPWRLLTESQGLSIDISFWIHILKFSIDKLNLWPKKIFF